MCMYFSSLGEEKKKCMAYFFFVCTYSSLWSPWQFAPNANGLCWSSVCHLFVPPSAVVAIFRSPDKFSSTYEQLIVECIRNEEPVGNFRNAVFTVEKCFGIILLYVCADAILRTNGETAGEAWLAFIFLPRWTVRVMRDKCTKIVNYMGLLCSALYFERSFVDAFFKNARSGWRFAAAWVEIAT